MDYVKPAEVITEALQAAEKKAALSIPDMLIRGMLAGAFLGYATSLVMVVQTQGVPPIVGAILFPVGFVMLVLLGLELATGNFALLPLGLMAGQVPLSRLLRNWAWVYLGNLLGSVFYAFLFYLAVTNCGTSDGGPLAETLRALAKKKTLGYQALGGAGWTSALVKGILCNWMVTLGTMLAFVSRSTVGKVAAMWLPILTFFAHGYEHSIVNMFVIPAGMFFGSGVSTSAWWIWNQIPVTVGNILSGALFTGMAFYLTYHSRQATAAKPELASAGFPQSMAAEEPVQ